MFSKKTSKQSHYLFKAKVMGLVPILYSKFSAQLGVGKLESSKLPTALENTSQAQLFRLSARNHCSNVLRSHWALEVTARACFLERLKATEHSKTVLEHASFSFEATESSKPLLERAFRPLSALKHCSSMLLFHSKALSSMLLFPSKALSIMLVFPSKSLSKSLCFELCIASSGTLCDFTGTVRCHMRI